MFVCERSRKGYIITFSMLKTYQQEQADNATNLNFFKQTVVNMGSEFSERFQEFRKDKATMSFY